jgi:hypothetical protein
MNLKNYSIDFESIVKQNQEKVRNICFRYVNNVDDADDIAQEVFIQVFESLSHFREEAQISTWVTEIIMKISLPRFLCMMTALMVMMLQEIMFTVLQSLQAVLQFSITSMQKIPT